jgi:hypothetical protein
MLYHRPMSNDWSPDPDEEERLLEQIPLLARARRFGDVLDEARFFARAGDKLMRRDREAARLYCDGLGFTDAEPALLSDWDEAMEALSTHDINSPAWEREEFIRADLSERVFDLLDEEGFRVAERMVADKASEAARRAVDEIRALYDIEDEAFLNAAAGATIQASHGALLTFLVFDEDDEPEDQPLLYKFRLFAYGRWPIGLIGNSLNLL